MEKSQTMPCWFCCDQCVFKFTINIHERVQERSVFDFCFTCMVVVVHNICARVLLVYTTFSVQHSVNTKKKDFLPEKNVSFTAVIFE